MATYYCDPATVGGLNNGSSWANAWTDITSYTNAARADGDICYARGTQVFASAATLITLADGGNNNAYLSIIGCNAAGTARAGQFTIQGAAGDLPVDLMNMNAKGYWLFENVTFDAATTQLIHYSANISYFVVFKNCRFINSSGAAITSPEASQYTCAYILCIFQNNTGTAITGTNDTIIMGCKFIANGAGVVFNSLTLFPPTILFNIFHANGNDDIMITTNMAGAKIIGNTFNGNVAGSCIKTTDRGFVAMFNKFTNANQYGIEQVGAAAGNYEDYNLFFGNVVGEKTAAVYSIGLNDISGANAGMVNVAGDDFRTALTSSLRRIALNIDWDLATPLNTVYPTAGLPPDDRIKTTKNTNEN